MLPVVLDMRITSRCNMKCPFCFGTTARACTDLAKQLDFLGELWDRGCRNIVITGGEPSLAPDFPQLLREVYSMGYQIVLSTNGSFWSNRDLRTLVLDKVACMALPIESEKREVHNQLRRGISDHYQMVYQILEDIYREKLNIHIKIGTVVTQTNITSLKGILEGMPFCPDIWKLYQLSKCKKNVKFYEKQCITDKAFADLVDTVKQHYSDWPVRIVGSTERDRDGKYLFMEPDGRLLTIVNNEETVVGTIYDSETELFGRIESMVNAQRTNSNFYSSFIIEEK